MHMMHMKSRELVYLPSASLAAVMPRCIECVRFVPLLFKIEIMIVMKNLFVHALISHNFVNCYQ